MSQDDEDPDTPWVNKSFHKEIRPRWWQRDKDGWAIEQFEGQPFRNFLRIIFQNLKKITG